MMSEREAELLVMMEHCILNDGFCDTCINKRKDSGVCRKEHEEFFQMVKNSIAKRERLQADMNIVCGGKFVDVCCICGHYSPEHPGEKCELKGLDCRWVWRGEHHG